MCEGFRALLVEPSPKSQLQAVGEPVERSTKEAVRLFTANSKLATGGAPRETVTNWVFEDDPAAFDAVQNAMVAANAERYYRTMVRGDRQSWNIRDYHMSDTIDRIAAHHGPGSKGLVWAHNTHVGDARATDMAQGGMDNIGQLMRLRHPGEVVLAGFASYAGSVTAAEAWGAPEQTMTVPAARQGSHEDLLNNALGEPSLLVFGSNRTGRWLTEWRGHRAIGVVYDPEREAGNYVPTRMAGRYDALLWIPHTTALRPLHHEQKPGEPEFETEPSGF